MEAKVLAVVVCYNPRLPALQVMLTAIRGQVAAIAVLDNASGNTDQIADLIQELCTESDGNIELHRNTSNLGLGAAHNKGIQLARDGKFSHVLLLDQDSVPMNGMVERLVDASLRKSAKTPVSAVGVTYLNADNGSESFFVRFGPLKFRRLYCADRDEDGCIEADFLISSGSLISLSTLDDVGLMDEQLFIDHVDTEWFLRARDKGYHAFGVCDAIMQHGLGDTTHQINLGGQRLGRRRNVPQHKPFRYYYIFRNSILLYRRSYASGLWKWNDAQRLVMIAVMFGLFKAPRLENMRMMLKGLLDGLRGRAGKAF